MVESHLGVDDAQSGPVGAQSNGTAVGAHSAPNSHLADRRSPMRLVAIAIAVGLQLVVAVPFTVGMGLLAPLWAFVVAWLLWLAAAVALVITARRRPLHAPLVPIVNAALLFGFVAFGTSVLRWAP